MELHENDETPKIKTFSATVAGSQVFVEAVDEEQALDRFSYVALLVMRLERKNVLSTTLPDLDIVELPGDVPPHGGYIFHTGFFRIIDSVNEQRHLDSAGNPN